MWEDELKKKFEDKFISFQADGTEGWGAGLYLNDKIMPEDIWEWIEQSIESLLKQQREICASVDITDNFRIKQFTIPQSNAILNAPEPEGEIK